MDYKTFKNEISNLKAYYKSKKEIEDEIEKLWYDLTGVKGIRFDIEHASFNPSLIEETRLELLDKIEQKEKELDYTLLVIKHHEAKLKALPDEIKGYVKQIFIEGKTFEEVAKNSGYTHTAIHYRVKKAVEEL